MDAKPFLYSQSHQNDPLGASVANEVIQIIKEEKLIDRSRMLGEKIHKRLNILKKSHPIIKSARGRGLMLAIELEKHAEEIRNELFRRGFILVKRKGAEVLRMDPALTIPEHYLDLFLETFEQIIENIENK